MARALLLGVLLATAGCMTEGTNTVNISFAGTVRVAGEPLQGALVELFRPDVAGLPENVGTVSTPSDGTYTVATTIQERLCILVFITVEVRDPAGELLHEGRGNTPMCGVNTVNFDF